VQQAPEDTTLRFELAQVQAQLGLLAESLQQVETVLAQAPDQHAAWLMLAELRDAAGDGFGALRARYQAIHRAQRAGQWLGPDSTDPAILEAVLRHIDRLRRDRRDWLHQSFDTVRRDCGGAAVARVETALAAYLGEVEIRPAHPQQRPKFLYFPGLPEGPYHDPLLHPWAPRLRDAWRDIRSEAMQLLSEDKDFESFLGLKPGQRAPQYVGGRNPEAAWDAYFFYRHGQRYDSHHDRCPMTSAALESVDLCRVARQAPEACFSVIRPQSTIMAHHGVTNTRLVMHLPLLVPPGCALNVIGLGEHHWREGELMMFDDTYEHEAWNHADQPRLILLMDCWNPHLTGPEQRAVKLLVEAIDNIEN
jgi:aspartyl/asparaginyl beta-hydroxylase (cupin superfamily)